MFAISYEAVDRPPLTQDRLKTLLSYDPETGVFRRRIKRGGQAAGSIAGSPNSNGRNQIMIDGRLHLASRLAWLYMTGTWPAHMIDHENLKKDDDRWLNLRPATRSQNGFNRTKMKHNTSGFKGVCWDKANGKFQARINISSKTKTLGYFDSAEAAAHAYDQAAVEHHGSFARLNGPIPSDLMKETL